MSTTIDSKVVEMRFDNKQFERGVETSIDSIEKLNKSLDMKGATKGLENVDAAAKKINMSGLSNAVESVHAKFSAMEVVAVTALANITNSAVNAGKRIVSALTIDPIKAGFSEYETKINSIQTIMSNTASKGTTMEDVTRVIGELNTYADKTIYNFAEMTRNIGTFTAAGIGLEESASAIQGIANLAAASGSTSQQASTAMYQLSQAMAAGTVKLMDWNSVVNAGMGGEKFQEALKATAREHGIAVDDIIEANGSFRESLQEGWISADILSETLRKFTVEGAKDYVKSMVKSGKYTREQAEALLKEAQAMEDAATKVKTFTQLWDTLKESAQSGWSQSWEIIVGDFEEAKELLTGISDAIGGLIGASADARNEMLQGWKDLGGRTVLIEALWNAFDGLSNIFGTVKDAFRDIFPRMTAEQLYNITVGLKNFTENLKISEETAAKIKNTFKGVFAVFDIGIQAAKALVKAISPAFSGLFRSVKDFGGGILDASSNIGEFLANLSKTLKSTDFFTKKLDKLTQVCTVVGETIADIFNLDNILFSFNEGGGGIAGVFEVMLDSVISLVRGFFDILSVITGTNLANVRETVLVFLMDVRNKVTSFISDVFDGKIGQAISGFVNSVKEAFRSFGGVDTSEMDGLVDHVESKFEPLTAIGNFFRKVLDGIVAVTKKLIPVFAGLGSVFANAFNALGDMVSGAVGEGGLIGVAELINTVLSGGIIVAITKFVKSLTDIVDEAKGFAEGFSEILDGVRGTLEAYQQSLKADAILKISIALGILVVSLALLASIDGKKLAEALTAMSAMLAELLGSMKVLQGITGPAIKMSIGLIGLATAILILTHALDNLAGMDQDSILNGLLAVGSMAGILAGASKVMSTVKGPLVKAGVGMILISTALLILSEAVEKLGALKMKELEKGLIGVGVLCAELALFLKVADLDGVGALKGVGLMALAVAVNILAKAVGKFASMDSAGMLAGLAAVGVVLGELALFVNLTGNAKKVTSTAVGLTILGVAMLLFAAAVEDLGAMSWESLGKGLLSMATALGAVTLAMNAMPKGMMTKGAGLLGVATALIILSGALHIMSAMSWEGIARSLALLAGSMTVLAVALNVMKTALPGAAALTVAASALLLLAPALLIFSNMSLAEIGKSLLMIAGVFVILGGAAFILKPLVTTILALSASLAVLGVGVLAIGVGLLAFATALSILAVSGTAAGAAITLIVSSLVGLIPMVIEQVAKGLLIIVRTIIDAAPLVAQAVLAVVLAIVAILNEALPPLLDTIGVVLLTVLEFLMSYGPVIIETGLALLMALLQGIADNMFQITVTAVSIITEFINGIASQMDTIVQAGFNLIINFINGLANGIRNNADVLMNAVFNLMDAVIKAIGSFVVKAVGKGGELIGGLIKGFFGMLGKACSAIGSLVGDCVKAIGGWWDDFKEAAGNLISGFISGIWDGITGAVNAIGDFCSSIGDAVCDFFGINSPSRLFRQYATYMGEGMSEGLENSASDTQDSAYYMGEQTMTGFEEGVADSTEDLDVSAWLDELFAEEFNIEPIITPVLDLTGVEKEARTLDTMFSSDLASSVSTSIANSKALGNWESGELWEKAGRTVNFTQNNYSPKSLSRVEIYRQTKNQLAKLES